MTTQAPISLESIDCLVVHIREHFKAEGRKLIAIAGPPGAGKSTVSTALRDRLPNAAVLQADGFHYDNALLEQLGRRQRKGAPDTFDCSGLKLALDRVRGGVPDIIVPVFDRELDVSRGSAAIIPEQARFIIVEGNYLASSEAPWADLRQYFDLMVYLDVSEDELIRRLQLRWDRLGWPRGRAKKWIESNDLPNILFTERTRARVDIIIRSSA